jgi:hypothetical protein
MKTTMKKILFIVTCITALLTIFSVGSFGQIKISEMTNTTNPVGGYIPIARAGANFKLITDSIASKKVDSTKVRNDSLFQYRYGGVEFFVSKIVTTSGITTLAAIGSSPNANGATISGSTLNLEPASTSFGGIVTNGLQSFDGTKTFFGTTQLAGGNFTIPNASATTGSTTQYLAGSTQGTVEKMRFNPAAPAMFADYSYITFLMAQDNAVTEAASGAHRLVSNLALQPITLNNGSATTTNAATFYIRGSALGTAAITNNYAMWVDSGLTRIDGVILMNDGADSAATKAEARAGGGSGGIDSVRIRPGPNGFDSIIEYAGGVGTLISLVARIDITSLADGDLLKYSTGSGAFINTKTISGVRWTARVGSTTSSATPTINTDDVDIYKLTAQAADITSFTTNLSGSPNDGDVLEIQITGTAARAITWGASFVSSTVALPTTTVTTATLTVILQYYTTSSYGNNKWVCVNYY